METKLVKQTPLKIQDIVQNKEAAMLEDQFKFLLNQNPSDNWLKANQYANNSKYLPIDKVEYLLDVLFQQWKVEILESKPIFNSIQVTIRLHYYNPVSGVWMFHDGVGASELQTAKDSGTLKPDFSNINKGAVEMAAPKAKSEAIKDAAHHIGKIFGRDVNRKNTIDYKMVYQQPNTERSRLQKFIQQAGNLEELEDVELHISKDDKETVMIWEAKKTELLQKIANQ